MSISSEIQRINTNIANAYTQANAKGATLPQSQNSANLASTIQSISTQLNLQSKTATPTTSQQVITPDNNYDGLSQVTVSAIQTETKTVKSSSNSQTITPTSGKFINEITVEALDLETKNVTPTTSAQTITPTAGKDGISQINVSAVDNTIDNNIVAREY